MRLLKIITEIKQAASDVATRLRLFNYFHQHYDTRTALNLARSRASEMRAIK